MYMTYFYAFIYLKHKKQKHKSFNSMGRSHICKVKRQRTAFSLTAM